MGIFPMPCNGFLARDLQEEFFGKPQSIHKVPLVTTAIPLYSDKIWTFTWSEKTATLNPAKSSIIDKFYDKEVNLVDRAKTKAGSERLQTLLSLENPNITWYILERVIDSIFELMADVNGCKMFSKLIDSCDKNQLQLIVYRIISESEILINALENSRRTANSIKKLINQIKNVPNSISQLIVALYRQFDALMRNRIAYSVIIECLNVFNSTQNELIYEAANKNCIQLATDEQGYLSLIEFITTSRRENLLQLISEHSVYLSQDPLGNFVIQHVIDLHDPGTTKNICSTLKNHYVPLSLQKAGSRVVEKCLNSPGMNYVVEEFLESKELAIVARNQFGNFVIKSALKVTKKCDSPLHYDLLARIKPFLGSLRCGYGKHVYNMIRDGVPLN